MLSFILRIMLKFGDLYPAAKYDPKKAILFYHRLLESYKFAFANRMHLGDDRFDNVSEVIQRVTSEDYINQIVAQINDSTTYPSFTGYYDSKVRIAKTFIQNKITLSAQTGRVQWHRQRNCTSFGA